MQRAPIHNHFTVRRFEAPLSRRLLGDSAYRAK